MKKSIKSLISILTIAMMLLALVPTAMAAQQSFSVTAPLNATISIFRNGEDTEESTTILTDGFYYSKGDVYGSDGVLASNTDKVISFNSANSGIKWSFDKITPVKRIDMWVLNTGAIDEYVIETRNSNSEDWKIVHTGTLAMYDEFDDTISTGTKANQYDAFYSDDASLQTWASYYPIILPQNVSAKDIRFRIVSFPTSINGTQIETAHISQTMIYDTNDINLWYYNAAYYSPYRTGYSLSTAYQPTNKKTSLYKSDYRPTAGSYQAIKPFATLADTTLGVPESEIGRMWYATSFERSDIKINRIAVNVTAGTIKKVKIHVIEDNHINNFLNHNSTLNMIPIYNTRFNPEETSNSGYIKLSGIQSWTEEPVYTIDCNLTKNSTTAEKTIDIPQAIAASGIFIEFEYEEEENVTPTVSSIGLYSVADYELNPGITKSDLSGTVDAGETVTLNLATKELTNANAKVYFAVYSGDELKAAQAVGCPFTGTATYSPIEYTIPATAGDNLTLKAFIWDGTTLKPLLATPVVVGE